MPQPKMIMKVELQKKTDVKFTILQMTKNIDPNTNFLFTNNNWTIYRAKNFLITKKNILCLPTTGLRQEYQMSFSNNDERYDFMKSLAKALEYWSGSHLFQSKKSKVNFHKTVWVIF